MVTLGVDIGSSSVKGVVLENGMPADFMVKIHEGSVASVLQEIIEIFTNRYGKLRVMFTGGDGRKMVHAPGVILPVAIEAAVSRVFSSGNPPSAVVSMGGEEFVVYKLDSAGRITGNVTGDKCAAGTGEFFRQQLSRMNMTLENLNDVDPAGTVHKISARCSVFMKSDCTHKLNKKEATPHEIVLSLSNVMAIKLREFLTKAGIREGNVLAIGGVSRNLFVLQYLKNLMPELELITLPESPFWEAYGVSLLAENLGADITSSEGLFKPKTAPDYFLNSLKNSAQKVTFIEPVREKIMPGRQYILGVDGGSTTTKVVLVDYETLQITASHYGRTHGDPVKAIRNCITEIKKQIVEQISEEGLETIRIPLAATTGSSREILGVFLETPGVFNEIIAHTAGTTFFNEKIDTIFEIGGQDAKYVYLDNNVPIDYAMNEACSAGTGSFIEESASGDLNIHDVTMISDIALASQNPAKFGEHCSAFINSDIRKAIQDDIRKEDIVAGLIYSIVSNYLNRVVGNRAIGKEIVLQGGVAKNKALAYAFAEVLRKNITVPPDPELMGAFGVALLAKRNESRIGSDGYHLDGIITSKIDYGKSFHCKSCENDCPIATIIVNDHKYFFGGRCDKYTNIRKKNKIDMDSMEDLSEIRRQMVFVKYAAPIAEPGNARTPKVAIPWNFSVFDLWPLYSHYFHELGAEIIPVEENHPEGKNYIEAPFCFPAEIAHGRIAAMLKTDADFYFLPQLRFMESQEKTVNATLCPIVQGLPYYARSSFPMDRNKILAPVIDFSDGYFQGDKPFLEMAERMGFSAADGKRAFLKGMRQYLAYKNEAREIGRRILREAEENNEVVIALLGRSYNLFDDEANLGIPRKFLSRGYRFIPNDFMPVEGESISENMYWYWGQINLKSSVIAKNHPNVFVTYISNFSCAPDSFILHQVRWIMGSKPFLVLELDSHSADAGIDTRIEAFLDIVRGYREKMSGIKENRREKKIAAILDGKNSYLLDKRTGEKISFKDPRVTVTFPSMGRYATEAVVESVNGNGIRSVALDVPTFQTTQLARDIASGKECIPTLITMGSTLDYFQKNPPQKDQYYLVLIPSTTGPCRTGQYGPWFDRVFETLEWENVTTLPLSSDNSYTELGSKTSMYAWWALVIADFYKDMQTAAKILALNPETAETILENEWQKIKKSFAKKTKDIMDAVHSAKTAIAAIPKSSHVEAIKKVLIVGEIYVRRDDFSQNQLLRILIKNHIMGKITGIAEWINYTSYLQEKNLKSELRKKPFYSRYFSREFRTLAIASLENWYKKSVEHRVKKQFSRTGLVPRVPDDMEKMMQKAKFFTDVDFETEATISSISAAEASHYGYSGVIIIAPFACLIGRLAKSIMTPYMREKSFPVITIENDGLDYPPSILSQLEIFMMNVNRYGEDSRSSHPVGNAEIGEEREPQPEIYTKGR